MFFSISLEEGFGLGHVKFVELCVTSVVPCAHVLTPLEQWGTCLRVVPKGTLHSNLCGHHRKAEGNLLYLLPTYTAGQQGKD